MSSAPSARNPLFLAELLYAILDAVAEPTSEPFLYNSGIQFQTPDADGQRALAALARTCRAFTEPSLDLLWRRLHSLQPLLRCFMPREAFLGGMVTLRLPSTADWAVINRYAYRIQQLEVQNDNYCLFLGCTIFEFNLLPNLKALKWKKLASVTPTGITYIQPLLHPGLVVLDVCGSEYDISLASFLKSCPSRCPNVTTARFRIHMDAQLGLIDILSQALCSFQNLKSLTVGARVNDGALQHFLMSPQFQELSLWIRSYQLRQFSPLPSDVPLRNMKKLDLRLDDLHLITELLRPGVQNFHQITLLFERLELGTLIGSLFTGLAPHAQQSSLRSFHIRNTQVHFLVRSSKSFVLSFDTFRPLTSHINLRKLIIDLENPISLSDEDLADLACNWPLLQVVEFCYVRPPPPLSKYMTFNGLLQLVTVCRELCHVGLTLDGRKVPSGAVAVGLGSRLITTLRFPNSPIDNQARLVAKFLWTHFPSVISVSETRVQTGAEAFRLFDRHIREWAEVEGYLFDASKVERAGR